MSLRQQGTLAVIPICFVNEESIAIVYNVYAIIISPGIVWMEHAFVYQLNRQPGSVVNDLFNGWIESWWFAIVCERKSHDPPSHSSSTMLFQRFRRVLFGLSRIICAIRISIDKDACRWLFRRVNHSVGCLHFMEWFLEGWSSSSHFLLDSLLSRCWS